MNNKKRREGTIFDDQKQGLFKVYDSINQIIRYEFYSNNLLYTGMYDSLNLKTGDWIILMIKKIVKKEHILLTKKIKNGLFL